MQNYLTADNLTVGYRGKPILSDISMNIRRGSIVTLIGPNGAGKSTILKSIIRELSPLGGSVFLDGTALEDYSDPDFAKKTAVVMTGRPDPELMTCFDVAAAGRYPYTGRFGILSKEDKKKVMDALEMVRCESLADVFYFTVRLSVWLQPVKEYSALCKKRKSRHSSEKRLEMDFFKSPFVSKVNLSFVRSVA